MCLAEQREVERVGVAVGRRRCPPLPCIAQEGRGEHMDREGHEARVKREDQERVRVGMSYPRGPNRSATQGKHGGGRRPRDVRPVRSNCADDKGDDAEARATGGHQALGAGGSGQGGPQPSTGLGMPQLSGRPRANIDP